MPPSRPSRREVPYCDPFARRQGSVRTEHPIPPGGYRGADVLKLTTSNAEIARVELENATRIGARQKLGEILVRKGRLTREQLNDAVVEARNRGVRLGSYLVDSKI